MSPKQNLFFSVAVWVGYIALFGVAVETGVVMVVYLHEALDRRLASGVPLTREDIRAATIDAFEMQGDDAPGQHADPQDLLAPVDHDELRHDVATTSLCVPVQSGPIA